MQSITYKNSRGQTITCGIKAPFILKEIKGTGEVDNNVISQKAPYQNGNTFISSQLDVRDITLKIVIVGSNQKDLFQKRAELASIFNPKLNGVLTYKNDHTEKQIKCCVDSGVKFSKLEGSTIKTIVDLTCNNPFWLDTYTESERMADFTGGLTFPVTLPMQFKTRSTRTDILVLNKGDVETPLRVEFTGVSVNPKLINITTGESIQVNQTINDNEKLVINTEFGNKEVKLINLATGVETDVFGYLDLDSTFFNLGVGDNILNFEADSGEPVVYIYWDNRYVGV